MTYKAIEIIEKHASQAERADKDAINRLFSNSSVQADVGSLTEKLLYACDITLNFHPDRFSNNGKLIIENLMTDGEYHNQYKTGTSNGGLNPYIGGNRDKWENCLFQSAYHDGLSEMADRPKYGGLNIHNYIDGASPRFGSCFFTMMPHVVKRCTFAYGDSNTNPNSIATAAHFYGIVKTIFQNVQDTGDLLGKSYFTIKQAVDYILSLRKDEIKTLGRDLDNYIETHIHGKVSLLNDVDSFYIDESFIGTDTEKSAVKLSERYDIKLRYIPKRKYLISQIDDKWKGPLARPLAEKIDERFDKSGVLDAAIIGLASRDSVINQSEWLSIGSQYELFQNFKYLWHYVAHFG